MKFENGSDITWKQLKEVGEYILIDNRDESLYQYGTIAGAVHVTPENLEEAAKDWSRETPLCVFCKTGATSREFVDALVEKGYLAYNIQGGYNAWLLAQMEESEQKEEAQEENRAEEIEKSIRKKFHKQIFSRFAKAINQYQMLQEGDKVAVCISGGKDSMLMAKCFQELKRHNKFQFDLVFLVMDPGYNEINRKLIETNAKMMNIPITIFESDIFDAVYEIEKSPCYLCARMRRGHLYSKAKELGCNKIALGHHYDDVIETILMGMLYGAQVQTMMPKLHSTNFEGMELIRPLYLVREDDIKHWRDYNHLNFLQCACHFTETCSSCNEDGTSASKRLEVKKLIRELKKENPYVEGNIFKSVENVNLSTVIAYKKDGVVHHFLDEYDQKE